MDNKRPKYIIAAVSFVIIIIAVYFLFIFQKNPREAKLQKEEGEVRQITELDISQKPYITLTPTADGAEIIISIENMSAFDRIEYELTYLADNPQVSGDKIQRGSTGTDVNPKDAKYKKSMLLGTASKGVKSPDIGIEDGKLTLHLFKGDTEFQSETPWRFVTVGRGQSTISSSDSNFTLKVGSFPKNYWVILTDTVGIPPKPPFDIKSAILPVWGVFSIAPEFDRTGELSIKMGTEDQTPTLYSYNNATSSWTKIDSTYQASTKTITVSIGSFATFVIVSKE